MPILGFVLLTAAVLLIFVWFGTRKMMLEQGTWESQGGTGAYLWLAIYIALGFAGLWLA